MIDNTIDWYVVFSIKFEIVSKSTNHCMKWMRKRFNCFYQTCEYSMHKLKQIIQQCDYDNKFDSICSVRRNRVNICYWIPYSFGVFITCNIVRYIMLQSFQMLPNPIYQG